MADDILEVTESEEEEKMEESALFDSVQITPDHIRANGTLHTSPFHGLAELIDNAVDSGATTVKIVNHSPKYCRYLTVTDDGAGMNREEALKTIRVGYSLKRQDTSTIGQFGNGLKSGAMRLGDTMVLATRKDDEITVLLISLRYMESIGGDKCYVPAISYTMKNRQLRPARFDTEKKHEAALRVILKYSPWQTEPELHEFLKSALSNRGTCVVIRHLRKLDDGSAEFKNVQADDLVMQARVRGEPDQRLSEFLQQLYLDPKITITINGRQVRVQDVRRAFACPRWTLLDDKGMESFKNRERSKIDGEIDKLTNCKDSVKESVRVLDIKLSQTASIQMRAEKRRLEMRIEEYEKQIDVLYDQMSKTNTIGAEIRVHFGIDLERRGHPRAIYYSNGRRILTRPLDTGKKGNKFEAVMGVVAVIDIPSTIMPTQQNREAFEVPSEFEIVARRINKHAKVYFECADKMYKTPEFWESLGYEPVLLPDDEADLSSKNALETIYNLMKKRRQCAKCRQFWTIDTTDPKEFDVKSLEVSSFQCVQGCKDKTRSQLREEEIKKLDEKGGKKTYYAMKEPEPPKPNKAKKVDQPAPVRGRCGSSPSSEDRSIRESTPRPQRGRSSKFDPADPSTLPQPTGRQLDRAARSSADSTYSSSHEPQSSESAGRVRKIELKAESGGDQKPPPMGHYKSQKTMRREAEEAERRKKEVKVEVHATERDAWDNFIEQDDDEPPKKKKKKKQQQNNGSLLTRQSVELKRREQREEREAAKKKRKAREDREETEEEEDGEDDFNYGMLDKRYDYKERQRRSSRARTPVNYNEEEEEEGGRQSDGNESVLLFMPKREASPRPQGDIRGDETADHVVKCGRVLSQSFKTRDERRHDIESADDGTRIERILTLQEIIRKQKTELSQANGRIDELGTKNAQLEEANAALRESGAEMKERVSMMGRDLDEAYKLNDQLGTKNEQLEEKCARLEKTKVGPEERVSKISKTIDQLSTKNAQLEEANAGLEETVSKMGKAIDQHSRHLDELARLPRNDLVKVMSLVRNADRDSATVLAEILGEREDEAPARRGIRAPPVIDLD